MGGELLRGWEMKDLGANGSQAEAEGKEPERLRFLGVPVFVSPLVSFAVFLFLHPFTCHSHQLSPCVFPCLHLPFSPSLGSPPRSQPRIQMEQRPRRADRGRGRGRAWRLRRAGLKSRTAGRSGQNEVVALADLD